jgi:hypothetical protein
MLLAGAALALIALTFKVIKFLISTFVGGIRWLIRKLPARLRPVANMMGIAGLLGGAAGYLMEASQHGSQPAIWTTTGIFASGAVMIVAAVTAAVTMTLATIRLLFKGLAGATRWLVGKSRQSFRAVPR